MGAVLPSSRRFLSPGPQVVGLAVFPFTLYTIRLSQLTPQSCIVVGEYVRSSRLIEPAPAAVRNCQVSVPEHLNRLVTNVHDLSFNPSSTRRGVPWGKDL